MAAIQTHKPIDQETTEVYRKTTTEACYNKANNERSFATKMKEMANSATKMFHHAQNEHQANNSLNKQHEAGYKAQQTGSGNSSNNTHATQNMPSKKKENVMTSCTGKKKKKKKKQEKVTFTAGKKDEKHGGGFLANMEEHVKLFAHKVEGRKKSKGHGSSSDDSSSSSSSSDESHNEGRAKKK